MQSTSKDDISKAWTDMSEDQFIDDAVLRPEIAASWRRSWGINHFGTAKPRLSEEMLQEKLRRIPNLFQ